MPTAHSSRCQTRGAIWTDGIQYAMQKISTTETLRIDQNLTVSTVMIAISSQRRRGNKI
jgi:hypothetical protein